MKKTFKFDESVVPQRFSEPSEKHMLEGFLAVANEVIGASDSYQKNTDTFLVGVELELPLVNADFTLAEQTDRDAVIADVPNTSIELAAHQLEVTPENPTDLKQNLLSIERAMNKSVAAVTKKTRALGLSWLRTGSYPLCHINEVKYTLGYEKYKRSPEWHIANQRPDADKSIITREGPLDVSNAYIVGLLNAVQITVDATSLADAIDKVNRSYMISPMAVALAANSTHLGYLDTGYADVRFKVWELSHDSRTHEEVHSGFPTRVGLPSDYFKDIHGYFNQVLSYPFVMNDASSMAHPFEVGNGIFWRDARLKFFRDQSKVGVEFRPVGLQPSLYEDLAIMLFYVGRLAWSQHHKEALIPMSYVRNNKEFAMSRGMQSKLYTNVTEGFMQLPAKEALKIELRRAELGLALLGASVEKRAHYSSVWIERLENGSPAEIFAKTARSKLQKNFADARINLIETMQELNLVEG